jgi:hypothetical protein
VVVVQLSGVDQRRTTLPEVIDKEKMCIIFKCSIGSAVFINIYTVPACLSPVASALLISLQVKVLISGDRSLIRQALCKKKLA